MTKVLILLRQFTLVTFIIHSVGSFYTKLIILMNTE